MRAAPLHDRIYEGGGESNCEQDSHNRAVDFLYKINAPAARSDSSVASRPLHGARIGWRHWKCDAPRSPVSKAHSRAAALSSVVSPRSSTVDGQTSTTTKRVSNLDCRLGLRIQRCSKPTRRPSVLHCAWFMKCIPVR